jgi:hypothetical protein
VRQPGCPTVDLGEQTIVLIEDPQHAMVDDDATVGLVELTDVEDACLQPRDEVHTSKGAVLAALTDEDDVASALNLRDGAVTEFHLATDLGVKLGEEMLDTDHMVGGTHV